MLHFVEKKVNFSFFVPKRNSLNFHRLLSGQFWAASPGIDVMIFKNIFAEKFSEKIGFFGSKQS
jgi:hypothetical protein